MEPGSSFLGVNHARYHDPSTPYHVFFRTFQGRFLLAPDRSGELNRVVAGVIGRAMSRYPTIVAFAYAVLSNHLHLALQGTPEEIPPFIAFIKREISRRWGSVIGWPGALWEEGYASTALPTEDSQQRAFEYILAQSTKEGLVPSPLQWPGLHCAKDLMRGTNLVGVWFDGTRYGKEVHRQKSRRVPRKVDREPYEIEYEVKLTQLPCWARLTKEAYRRRVRGLLTKIEKHARALRGRRGFLGRARVLSTSRQRRSALPTPPWYETRRRLICWANRAALETRRYLKRYWSFQERFREASRRLLAGELGTEFPPGSFRPSSFVRAP